LPESYERMKGRLGTRQCFSLRWHVQNSTSSLSRWPIYNQRVGTSLSVLFCGFSFKATFIFELWITDVWREFTFLAFRRVACVRYK
jgi:hypothetical protein